MTKKSTTHNRSRVRAPLSSAIGYASVLAEMKDRIAAARHRALATVNQELVALYWDIGRVIVRQQETAAWGDAVVEQLSSDLRLAFPDMKGLTKDNLFRMRKFFIACRDIDGWLSDEPVEPKAPASSRKPTAKKVGTAPPRLPTTSETQGFLSTVSRELPSGAAIVGTLSPQLQVAVSSLSWSQLTIIIGAVADPPERYFYMTMSVRERWSVRELRRQIDSGLYLRYMSVRRDPEKCLPKVAEQGDLLPFKDHYVLEFLGLEDEHTERQLRKAILANLRDFFLEFGRDLTFVGEEYPLTVGNDTFHIDLLFFQRRLQCLVAVDLKIGDFQPEYIGKSLFYVAALDEQIRLPHEKPSIGLVLCKSADHVQVRLALTAAAKKIGVATYQTALPDEKLIRQRLEQLPAIQELQK